MKKIVIVSYTKYAARIHKETLEDVFEDKVYIEILSLEKHIIKKVDADVAILVTSELVNFAEKILGSQTRMIIADYTIGKDVFNEIKKTSKDNIVSIVCEDITIALKRKKLLTNLGICEKRMDSWCPGMKKESLHSNVVAFGDVPIANDRTRKVIRVKGRLLSLYTIIEVAISISEEEFFSQSKYKKYAESVCIHYYSSTNEYTLSQYFSMIGENNLKMGILAFTTDFTIFYSDSFIENITNKTSKELVGKKVWEIFNFLKDMNHDNKREVKDKLIKYADKTYVMNQSILKLHNNSFGYIVLSDYWEDVNKQINLRKQELHKGYKAKYTFDNILGNSSKILQCKDVARKMAKSNANILISGPTGVGKELFAQSIHNESNCKEQPFIAVNCGAIVESLLESELFGYEKGSFTGASKEGRQGMFELAHNGTLFLDEIGEMPLHLQSKLLRVLQEREIVRVGGDKVIPIDVRIISATNKDLLDMVNKKKFRMDLYYRLNVLPLKIPALAERKEDIELLFYNFLSELGVDCEVSSSAIDHILKYGFPGNIRELQNCVEYIASLGIQYIKLEDLPDYIFNNIENNYLKDNNHKSLIELFKRNNSEGLIRQKWNVLNAVNKINRIGLNAGRRSIKTYLEDENIILSEYQIRKTLEQLEKEDFISIRKGRAGVAIKDNGKKVLDLLKYID